MALSNKRYYWIKLKENFFDLPTIDFLQEQKNGCEYIVLYLRLCLIAANTEGLLVRQIGEMIIPYDAKKISEVTKIKFDTVVVALDAFRRSGLIEERPDGVLTIPSIGEMIGSESNVALYHRERRKKLKAGGDIPLIAAPSEFAENEQSVSGGFANANQQKFANANLLQVANANQDGLQSSLQAQHKRLEIRDKSLECNTRVCGDNLNNNINNNINNTHTHRAREENDESVFDFSNSSPEKTPSLEEVKKFAEEMNYTHTDPAAFWQHYEFSNWRDQGGRLINWRQKLFKWERDDAERKVLNGKGSKSRMAPRLGEKERQLNAAEQRLLEQWGDD